MAEYISKGNAIFAVSALPLTLDAETTQRAIEAVRAVPAADVKLVVRGKWEKGRQCGILGNEYKCSFCSYQIIMEEKDKYNYCPNCGADMREV